MVSSSPSSEDGSSPSLPASHGHAVMEDAEHFELSTTVDPSYIIYLIRQLLPSLTMGDSAGLGYEAKLADNFVNREMLERQENECDNTKSEYSGFINTKQSLCDAEERMKEDSGKIVISEKQCHNHGKQFEGTRKEFTSFVINEDSEGKAQMINSSNEHSVDLETVEHKSVCCSTEISNSSTTEEQKEEAGCVLWDLAANQAHADFMVTNHLLEVLLGVFSVPQSDRMREICLGIMGNLACHPKPGRVMVRLEGLIEKAIQNLFSDDSPSLCEVCRLLSSGLHGEEAQSWAKSIASDEILERIIWITANTLQPNLLEKSTELLLAMTDGQKDITSALLPPLMRLGLQELLRDLLTCEITSLVEGKSSHGYTVLDALLQIAEALSLRDDYASQISADGNLFSLACQVVQISGKEEVGAAGITATVLIANLLAEREGFILSLVNDATFLKHLLKLLPFVGDDAGARNALWSILNRLSNRLEIEEIEHRSEMLSVLAEGCEFLSADLKDHMNDDIRILYDATPAGHSTNGSSKNSEMKLDMISNLLQLLEKQEGFCDDADRNIDHTIKHACKTLRNCIETIISC